MILTMAPVWPTYTTKEPQQGFEPRDDAFGAVTGGDGGAPLQPGHVPS